ncbi:hypothetical protein ISF6_0591 [Piscinibacter sakaiensis]|uniref:Uncharacterized protein n=2 Tax=Piscinibacter sakaiensis TaxID=1547922 RepID=A0A0K8NXC2_PISS1|nr:hypothetical protein ISF6_0591 [Piscinibacter sakaiensis]
MRRRRRRPLAWLALALLLGALFLLAGSALVGTLHLPGPARAVLDLDGTTRVWEVGSDGVSIAVDALGLLVGGLVLAAALLLVLPLVLLFGLALPLGLLLLVGGALLAGALGLAALVLLPFALPLLLAWALWRLIAG